MPNYSVLIERYRQTFNQPRLNLKITTQIDPDLLQSKIGGTPYLKDEEDLPHDLEGYPMRLLAQINYQETARYLIPDLPHEGLLQVWLSQTDPYFGRGRQVGSCHQQDWCVKYYPKIEKSLPAVRIKSLMQIKNPLLKPTFPLVTNKAYALDFERVTIPPLWHIYGASQQVEDFLEPLLDHEVEIFKDQVFEQWNPYGSMIAGYPAFNHQDPRWQCEDWQSYNSILLQLDSEGPIHWPDDGIAQWMISREDLLQRDFKHVLYTWGC